MNELPDDINAPAARGFVAMVLASALPETEYEEINSVADGAIPDVSLEDPFGPAVYLLYRAGIVIGNDGEGTFAPYSDVKRCETAAILTRIIDKSLRMSVTLGAADTAEKVSTEAGKTPDGQKTPDFRLPFFNLQAWEEAIRDHTERPVIPPEPEKPDKPEEPVDDLAVLAAAYRHLFENQDCCRIPDTTNHYPTGVFLRKQPFPLTGTRSTQ